MLKIDEILEIIKAVNQSSLTKFELEQEATRLVILKESFSSQQTLINQSISAAPDSLPLEVQQQQLHNTTVEESKFHKVLAPMIGTFYAAPQPDADPFVKVGQKVADSTVVCVVEAMKLFNELEAGIAGEIVEILAADGDFVEYGQPLFLVKIE